MYPNPPNGYQALTPAQSSVSNLLAVLEEQH